MLKLSHLSRASFFRNLKKRSYHDKNKELYALIKEIFYEHNENYGINRIKIELQNKYGWIVNKKKIQRIKNDMGLKTKIKRGKYNSFFRGFQGKIFKNLIKRNFKANEPLKKLTTDVTEFRFSWGKVYLQVILDMYNGEILTSVVSEMPTLEYSLQLINQLFAKYNNLTGAILHSDQGAQYHNTRFTELCASGGIIQSMSEKGNCLDNAVMENFFGRLKCEMFYGNEFKYKNFVQFKKELNHYINYYNNVRIKTKLKTSPVLYRKKHETMKLINLNNNAKEVR